MFCKMWNGMILMLLFNYFLVELKRKNGHKLRYV